MRIPVLDLGRHYQALKTGIDAAVAEVFASQQFIRGPQVQALEQAVAASTGTAHAVAVASGTDALLLSLEALELRPGDEVITTPFTFVATAETILRTGATPVFVDIDRATFNINPESITGALTAKTRGVLPVHLFGLPAAMDRILDIADRNGLWVLEDCAQAQDAGVHGRKAGSLGIAGAFSFYPTKNLGGCGDGGMVTTGNEALAEKLRILSEHGGRDKYDAIMLGHNSRLDTIQAAILHVKLGMLEAWIASRRRLADRYRDGLAGLGDLVLPTEPAGFRHTYNQFTVRTARRDALQEFLASRGVGSVVYYPRPLHAQALFRERARPAEPLPESERAAREVLSLPIDPLLNDEEHDYVLRTIREFYHEE